MPIGDWQFWIVTAACVVGLIVVVRPFFPRRKTRRRRRVEITVEQRALDARRSGPESG